MGYTARRLTVLHVPHFWQSSADTDHPPNHEPLSDAAAAWRSESHTQEKSRMKHIWTPWRKEYITGDRPEACLFCTKKEDPAEKDRENYILYRGPASLVMLNLFPYTNGHLMVAPYRHVDSVDLLDEPVLHEIGALTQASVAALKSVLSPHGFNIGVNQGRVAGAGLPDHVHVHVVPRWEGDANFMTVLAGTRLIPETLDDTYDTLLPVLRREIAARGI